MNKQAFYNGILYQIEYQPQLSNNDYTQHKVYYIKTEEEIYGKARKAIVSIMEEELGYEQGYLWSAGEHQIKNTQQPSMINAFHPYYKFSYEEDLDVFVFALVIPYVDCLWTLWFQAINRYWARFICMYLVLYSLALY